MENDIQHVIDPIRPCLVSRETHVIPQAPLVTVTALDIIAIDLLKADRTAGGYEYILFVIDQFTRYAQAYGTTNKSAKTIIQKIFNDFVLKFGIPDRMLRDQGKEFGNHLLDKLQKIFCMKKFRTTPYHPKCNGMVERLNSTLIQILRTLCEKLNQNGQIH